MESKKTNFPKIETKTVTFNNNLFRNRFDSLCSNLPFLIENELLILLWDIVVLELSERKDQKRERGV